MKKPIWASAPMADVTDLVFRELLAKYGKPSVTWTEFVSCDALCSAEGRKALLPDLKYTDAERPVVAQVFGSKPANFYKCAQLIKKLGFDGIDINMGCPDKTIEKQGAGAKLILDPELAKEIIRQTKLGAGDLPVSVKTRIGYRERNIQEWFGALIEAEPDVIIVHARTRKEMSKVLADWSAVKEVVKLVKKSKKDILVIGNGDAKSLAEAKRLVKESGSDGAMVGRALIGNPRFFNSSKKQITIKEKLDLALEHLALFKKLVGDKKNFLSVRKYLKAYVSGFDGASALRAKLMRAKDSQTAEKILRDKLVEV